MRDIFIAGRRTAKRAASSGAMRQKYTQSALRPAGGDAVYVTGYAMWLSPFVISRFFF